MDFIKTKCKQRNVNHIAKYKIFCPILSCKIIYPILSCASLPGIIFCNMIYISLFTLCFYEIHLIGFYFVTWCFCINSYKNTRGFSPTPTANSRRRAFARNVDFCFIVSGSERTFTFRVNIVYMYSYPRTRELISKEKTHNFLAVMLIFCIVWCIFYCDLYFLSILFWLSMIFWRPWQPFYSHPTYRCPNN